MKKAKLSGPAIFMYSVIAITLITSLICFGVYYGNINRNDSFLWIGITAFTIMYHLWMRIIFGNITTKFKKHISYKHWWFKERKFEKTLYKFLKVKKWKNKALTFQPELFSVKDYSLEEIANTMTKSELDHWINEILSLTTLAFGLIWGEMWIFALTAFVAMLFDAQFIVIQRFNRPRILKIIEKQKNKK